MFFLSLLHSSSNCALFARRSSLHVRVRGASPHSQWRRLEWHHLFGVALGDSQDGQATSNASNCRSAGNQFICADLSGQHNENTGTCREGSCISLHYLARAWTHKGCLFSNKCGNVKGVLSPLPAGRMRGSLLQCLWEALMATRSNWYRRFKTTGVVRHLHHCKACANPNQFSELPYFPAWAVPFQYWYVNLSRV